MKNNNGFMIGVVVIALLAAMVIPDYHAIKERHTKENKQALERKVDDYHHSPSREVNNPIGTEVVLDGKVYIIIQKK